MELFDFLEGEEELQPDDGLSEWKKKKSEARARMVTMQHLPYDVKKRRSELRANEFMEQMLERGQNAHVSVGGLDSITLHVFLKSIGIDVPAVQIDMFDQLEVAE